jgi:hypothetical protein
MSDYEHGRINRLRNNSIKENYSVHDIGYQLLEDKLRPIGYRLFEHGQDFRDRDDIYCGVGVDFEVRGYAEQTCGYCELKTKRSAEWMGRCNEEDWNEYRGFAAYADVPIIVCFALVDEDEQSVQQWAFCAVSPTDNVAEKLPFSSKGHDLVEVPDEELRGFPHFTAHLEPP